jgi:hypothetical protein
MAAQLAKMFPIVCGTPWPIKVVATLHQKPYPEPIEFVFTFGPYFFKANFNIIFSIFCVDRLSEKNANLSMNVVNHLWIPYFNIGCTV